MKHDYNVGDLITWESQSGGVSKSKTGRIVSICLAGEQPIAIQQGFPIDRGSSLWRSPPTVSKTIGNWCLTQVAPGQYNFDECYAELVQVDRNDEDFEGWELNEDGVTLFEGTRTKVEAYIKNSFVPEESLY